MEKLISMQDSLSKLVHNANVETHVLIRLQLNCIQFLSLARFGTKLEWICAAYPIQMKDLYVFVLCLVTQRHNEVTCRCYLQQWFTIKS